MAADGSVKGLPPKLKGKVEFCEPCLQGKMTDISHKPVKPKPQHLSPGEYVHMDICAYKKEPSIWSNRYFLLIKDMLTSYRKVYFLKEKSQAYNKFLLFMNELKIETGNKVLKIRTDKGSEFLSGKFLELIDNNGIVLELATKGTPQQNGLAERDNRTLVEHATSILSAAHLDDKFWDEAVNSVAYTLNRFTTGNNKLTPYEQWHGIKPNVSHLVIFGSEGQALIKSNVPKFHSKTKKVIFLGYEHDSETVYRCYDVENKRINTFDAVKFHEKPHCVASPPLLYELLPVPAETSSSESDEESTSNGCKVPVQSSNPTPVPPCEPEPTPRVVPKSRKKQYEVNPERLASLRSHATPLKKQTVSNANPPGESQSAPANDQPVLKPSSSTESANEGFHVTEQEEVSNPSVTNQVDVVCVVASGDEPADFHEAVESDDSEQWWEAMEREYLALLKNGTWNLVDPPPGIKPVGVKWVYKLKSSTKARFKARLVVLGYVQRPGIDFLETYAPVVKVSSLRILLSIAASLDLGTTLDHLTF